MRRRKVNKMSSSSTGMGQSEYRCISVPLRPLIVACSDPENPLNWSPRRKWLISIIGIMFSVMARWVSCVSRGEQVAEHLIPSLSVSGYSIGLGSVINELHTSRELAVLGITTFTITFGAVPLLLAPFSEVYGRSK